MMRGVNIFGRIKKNTVGHSQGAERFPPASSDAPSQSAPRPHAQQRRSAPLPRDGAPATARPAVTTMVRHNEVSGQRPPARASSPPSTPLPLSPTPRLMRLFPEYEECDDDVIQQMVDRQQQQQNDRNLQKQQQRVEQQAPRERKVPVQLPDGEKGLENDQGQYNCFINVVIQALWHLTAFRERFVGGVAGQQEHCCPGADSCVHCALQAIFVQYRFSEQSIIPPTALRQSLAALYKNESRFQLNQIDDAAEALEAILNRLHHTERTQKDKDADPAVLEKKACPCLVHNTFGVRTMDLLRCDVCSATTEPKATSLFVAYAYTYALREAREKAGQAARDDFSFCQFFQRAAQEDRRWCPNADRCNRMCVVEHHLLYLPKVFSVGLVWPSVEGAPVKEIEEVMDMISMRIDLSNIFITSTAIARYLQTDKQAPQDTAGSSARHGDGALASSLLGSGVLDDIVTMTEGEGTRRARRRKVKCMYELRGMICYYGQHYNCYFNSPATGQWYVFDDVMVNAVGPDWAAVKKRCLRGHLQPSVLFYEKKEVVETEEEEEEEEECASTDGGETASAAAAAPWSMPDTSEAEKETEKTKEIVGKEYEGMEALKRTIEAEILEMLMQGEEQWKREREHERKLETASRLPPSPSPPLAQEHRGSAEAGEGGKEDEGEEEEEEEEEEEGGGGERGGEEDKRIQDASPQGEEEGEEEEGAGMNGSWFVRKTDQREEADEEEDVESGEEEKDQEMEEEREKKEEEEEEDSQQEDGRSQPWEMERASPRHHGDGGVARPSRDDAEDDISEWELIDDYDEQRDREGDDHDDDDDDDDDDVEIIFENEREGQAGEDAKPRKERNGHRRIGKKREDDEENVDEEDDGAVEIVDEEEERRARRQRRRAKRSDSTFTILGAEEEETERQKQLDISFTMLDTSSGEHERAGGGGAGRGGRGAGHVEVAVTRVNWLYRRQSRLYRFAEEELLRIDPNTQALKDSFRYDEMAQILLYGSHNMVIRFNGDKDTHYIDGEGVEHVAHLLCVHNPDITLTRQ